jgi:hypothetical protein
MVDGAFVPKISSSTGAFELNSFTSSELVPFLSFDYERFALASAESILVSNLECQKHGLAGWPLLKLYYSAFFSAHAVMRSQGAGIIKLEKPQITKLNNFLSLLDSDTLLIKTGMYFYQIDTTRLDDPVISFTPHGAGNGVHEAFWKSFCDYIDKLANKAVATGAVDAAEMLAGSEEVCRAISGSNTHSGAWISTMRNEINYQHQHSVWFPLTKSAGVKGMIEGLQIKRSSAATLGTPIKGNPIKAFAEVSLYLACLNIDVAQYLSARSTKGGAFGQKWRRMHALII